MKDLLDHHAVAALFSVTTRTLRAWVSTKQVPTPIVMGRRRFWLKSTLEEWLANRAATATNPERERNTARSSSRRGRPRLPA
jgi:predicted DNA-binding transcriptional regulator AlpA